MFADPLGYFLKNNYLSKTSFVYFGATFEINLATVIQTSGHTAPDYLSLIGKFVKQLKQIHTINIIDRGQWLWLSW